ncbi:MAG: monooxygenase FAD-binding [Acidimicrobiia bacterium]|nr:monooxygenase FAD-binding [Acidimicrobiia bacterium]
MAVRDHAVVVGAGIAGLAAARVLSDRFQAVTIVERDRLPAAPGTRRGVPQGRHAHVLLGGGAEVLAGLFVGLLAALESGGAQAVDLARGRIWAADGYLAPPPQPLPAFMMSRPLLEHVVRQQVLRLPNVTIMEDASVRSLTLSRGRVVGLTGDAEGLGADGLAADLVVDASGRSSDVVRWLESAGQPVPATSTIHSDVGYASTIIEQPSDDLDGSWALSVTSPPVARAAGMYPLEGGRWIISLQGLHRDHPPSDAEGFLRFAASLPAPDVSRVLERAGGPAAIATYRFAGNQWRHFERLKAPTGGFLAMGDAFCSLNPIYGQGMTLAALQAAALADALDGGDADLPQRFYSKSARLVRLPWRTAAGGDFRYSATTGERPPAVGFTNWYLEQVLRAAQHDGAITEAFIRVQNLQRSPLALMAPAVAWKALGRRRAPIPPPRRSDT